MSSYLVLGGCGFIGRNIVSTLVQDETVEKIIVCDKTRPELSWLTPEQKACFDNSKVKYKQINLSNTNNCTKYIVENPCDYVINAAAETRLKMSINVYEEHIYKLGMNVAKAAASINAKKFVQVSSARIKILDKKSKREDSLSDLLACQKKLENDLSTIQGLNYTVIRPALVYGSGDKNGLTPMLIIMSIYKKLNEEVKLLWDASIPLRTVHVKDVAAACIHAATKVTQTQTIFELADESNSTQGSVADTISGIFGVKHEFVGKIQSMLAKTFFEDVVQDINNKHIVPWTEACNAEEIRNTPLYPYVTEEQLMVDDFSVDGSKIKETGFTYSFPKLESTQLKAIVDEYVAQKLFPKSCSP